MGREIQSVIPMISYEDGIAAMDGIIPDYTALPEGHKLPRAADEAKPVH